MLKDVSEKNKKMNLKTFTDNQDEKSKLIRVLKNFATQVQKGQARRAIMISAEVEEKVYGRISLADDPTALAFSIFAHFKDYRVDQEYNYYYPMRRLLKCLLNYCEWNQDQEKFIEYIIAKGQQKLKALTLRQAIGRIESTPEPKPENGIGTGILIDSNFLLTCNHIFTKNSLQKAWVRLNYTEENNFNLPEDLFELDLNDIKCSSQYDYALIKIKGQPQQKPMKPTNINLNSGQEIRIIHHPAGKKIIVSELGKIVKVGRDYVDYNLDTDEGSSGAPIFDQNWQFVAIHRGNLGTHEGRDIPFGITSGVPISAFFPEIQTYLSSI